MTWSIIFSIIQEVVFKIFGGNVNLQEKKDLFFRTLFLFKPTDFIKELLDESKRNEIIEKILKSGNEILEKLKSLCEEQHMYDERGFFLVLIDGLENAISLLGKKQNEAMNAVGAAYICGCSEGLKNAFPEYFVM